MPGHSVYIRIGIGGVVARIQMLEVDDVIGLGTPSHFYLIWIIAGSSRIIGIFLVNIPYHIVGMVYQDYKDVCETETVQEVIGIGLGLKGYCVTA